MELNNSILQNILQYGDIGVHVINRDRITIVYNQVMANLEGLDTEQAIGKDILTVFPSLNKDTSTLIKVMDDGKPILDSTQTYLNFKGYEITSTSSTIPLFINNNIVGAIEISSNVTGIKDLSDQLMNLQKQLNQLKTNKRGNISTIKRYNFSDIIGNSKKLKLAKDIGRKASASSSSILIYGETGTGKELFAQSIHNEGYRNHKPFIAQNCADIPETLLEGILFGTEKGGFTGAIEREGIFEQAHGGTLLLDEINSMSISLQAKLLRVLQEGYIRRIGGTVDIPIDVRIIATTNEDPIRSMDKGRLRKDLYYRLSVINISIPPLRMRIEDLEELSNHFIKKYNIILNKSIKGISSEVLIGFKNYSWPGNIRELENFIEGAMNMTNDIHTILKVDDFVSSNFIPTNLNLDFRVFLDIKDKSLPILLEEIEKEMILTTLADNENNITRSAKSLGIKRQTLQHKIKKHNKEQ